MVKWLGSLIPSKAPKLTPEEKASKTIEKMSARAKLREARDADKIKRHEQREESRKKRGVSIEKLIIAVADRGYFAALIFACVVAYLLDAIFFFQQTTLIWLSLLLCLFGLVIRTVAITGGVVLQAAEEEENKVPPGPLPKLFLLRWAVRAGRIAGRFSLARTTIRTVTIFCWVACSFASLSFFASGQEMRTFEQSSIETVESTTVANKQERMERLRNDKLDITNRYTSLINGARQSMNLVLDDGNKSNDDVSGYERNIKAYEEAMNAELAKKDVDIKALEEGKETAQVSAASQKAETPPFLAVYVFLARLTHWIVGDITTWVNIFFAIVLELLVDTGLQNYFGMKKKHMKRLRAIEMRQILEDHEWEINRFNTISAANLAKARAKALAEQNAAMQEQELAEIRINTEREKARTDAALAGKPWVDPAIELAVLQKKAQADADERMAKIEAEIRDAAARAEAARNPPKPLETTPPPANNDEPLDWRLEVGPDGLNHYQRMAKKSHESRTFDNDRDDIDEELKIKTGDWRTRFVV